jgi:hypothetical protein
MRTIWKVELDANMRAMTLVEGAKPLCVQMQNDIPCMWVEVWSERPVRGYDIVIVGTGQPIPPGPWQYAGTFQIDSGSLVFHVYLES